MDLRDRLLRLCEPEPNSGCWLWMGVLGSKGSTGDTRYGQIKVHSRPARAHRVAYETFVGPIPTGLVVMHRCDTPTCINPSHLRLGTQTENHADMVSKRRHPHLESGRALVTMADVGEMRRLWAGGIAILALSRQFGVSETQAHRIVKGESWVAA